MKRLTKKVHGVWTALCRYEKSPFPIVAQEIIDRLAAYEDTGLAPEEIQIQKEAMERMGWFGKMFQRYKGDPRGPIGTLGTALGKSLVVLNVESAKNRQPGRPVQLHTQLQSENVDSRNTGVCGLIKETGKTPKEENKDD